MSNKLAYAVIGTGISGISISKMLSDNGFNVELFEKKSKIGGLIKCEKISGHLFHKVGGHVFNSKDNRVLDWFWSNFDRENEFVQAERNAKIFINNSYVGYPIENFIYQLDSECINQIIEDLLYISSINKKRTIVRNFKSFLLENFGKTLFELYFRPYNNKIWNTDLSNIPLDWLEGKLPMPNIKNIISSNFLRAPENAMVHSTFWYPKSGGSQFIIDRLSKNLKINKNFNLTSIDWKEGKLLVNNNLFFDSIIYTGNVKDLINIIKIDDKKLIELLLKTKQFKSNGTSNVLCETNYTNLSWLYLPEEVFSAHRIIYTGNFSENNNASIAENRRSCVVEFSGKHSIESINKEISKLPGNLKPISYNYEENSYVIQGKKTREIINDIKTCLSKYKIYLHGRFAEWEYYNMDICIERSLTLSSKLLNEEGINFQ
jgi:protoporphyrinogen oxidase